MSNKRRISPNKRTTPGSASRTAGQVVEDSTIELSGTPGVPISSTGLVQSPSEITVFLSYVRSDNDNFDFLLSFKELLKEFVHAKSGRRIRTFIDQENISWGDFWKERLEQEVLGAAVFIPLLSANYLESDACRMEYNKFQAAAKANNVIELLLPVLLLRAPAIFNENSPDDLVLDAISREYECIEEAVLSNRGSQEWKRTMSHLADRFTGAYQIAEARLALADSVPVPAEGATTSDDVDSLGMAEIMVDFQNHIGAMTNAANALGPAIGDLGGAAEELGGLHDNPTPKEVQVWTLRAANLFRAPAEKIGDEGQRLFLATRQLDVDLSQMRRIAMELTGLGLRDSYNVMLGGLTGLDEVRQQIESLLGHLRPAEYLSVPLRKSLQPARTGLTRITDAISMIETWTPLAPE